MALLSRRRLSHPRGENLGWSTNCATADWLGRAEASRARRLMGLVRSTRWLRPHREHATGNRMRLKSLEGNDPHPAILQALPNRRRALPPRAQGGSPPAIVILEELQSHRDQNGACSRVYVTGSTDAAAQRHTNARRRASLPVFSLPTRAVGRPADRQRPSPRPTAGGAHQPVCSDHLPRRHALLEHCHGEAE